MESKTVHAIVLRRRDAGESDRRLTLLTLEEGKIDSVAKGARKSGSRLAGASEPLVATVLQLAPGKRNSFITQSQPQTSYPGLRKDYERLTFAIALAELYEALLPYQEPFPEAYQLLLASLQALQSHEKPKVAFVWAQVALLGVTGFLPQFSECVQTGQPVQEALPFLSPTAGGYVVADRALYLHDRFQARAEVLYGLSRMAELGDAPPNLRHAEEALIALFPFWRQIADRPLPGLESCVNEVKQELNGPTVK